MELASDHRKDPGLLLTFLVVIRALEAVGTSASLPCSLPLGLRPEVHTDFSCSAWRRQLPDPARGWRESLCSPVLGSPLLKQALSRSEDPHLPCSRACDVSQPSPCISPVPPCHRASSSAVFLQRSPTHPRPLHTPKSCRFSASSLAALKTDIIFILQRLGAEVGPGSPDQGTVAATVGLDLL